MKTFKEFVNLREAMPGSPFGASPFGPKPAQAPAAQTPSAQTPQAANPAEKMLIFNFKKALQDAASYAAAADAQARPGNQFDRHQSLPTQVIPQSKEQPRDLATAISSVQNYVTQLSQVNNPQVQEALALLKSGMNSTTIGKAYELLR